jgi:hypothetical protein
MKQRADLATKIALQPATDAMGIAHFNYARGLSTV